MMTSTKYGDRGWGRKETDLEYWRKKRQNMMPRKAAANKNCVQNWSHFPLGFAFMKLFVFSKSLKT
jgi:hypothetical protein